MDIKTLFFFFSAGNFFIAFFISLYILAHKNTTPIINIFLIAKVLISVHFLLFGLRNEIQDIYTIVMANILFIFGYFYEIYCIVFANEEIKRNHFIRLFFVPFTTTIIFLSFLSAPEHTRVVIASFIITIFFLGGGFYLVFAKEKTKIQRLTGFFYVIVSIFTLWRGIWAGLSDTQLLLLSNKNIQILSYYSIFLVSFSSAIIMLLILKEKDEERITKDNQKLLELNANKDKFFSIIAHDLKGPLNNLSQLGELLLLQMQDEKDKEQQEITNYIIRSAKGTFNLLDNLLKWANLNSGKMEFNPKMVALGDIVHEYFSIFEASAKSKKIALHNHIKDDVVVFADYNMLHAIIRNLVSNALKFTPESGTIIVKSAYQDNNMVSMGVIDTGVGIAPDIAAHLFDLGSKHTTVGTNSESGSGLGLKLCKEFVLKNRGDIWVKSKIDVGSEFWFSLPTAPIIKRS